MVHTPQQQSIHALAISAIGGTPARQGFDLQDHVAARYCILMISEAELGEVWCEAHDDVTIIWHRTSGEEVEFVQVKKEDPNQLWSLSKLCQQDSSSKNKAGTSILERSLAQHRCKEPCWFRIVTSRDVMDELRPLTYPIHSAERDQQAAALKTLSDAASTKVNGFKSPNGGDCSFWIARARWEVVHSTEAVETKNRLRLAEVLDNAGPALMTDQVRELYLKLLKLVYDAGLADTAAGKKLSREQVLTWIQESANHLAHPATVSGTRMREKMEAAKLSQETIDAAHDSRWRYRRQILNPRYAGPSDHKFVEGEVVANLNMLLARLDTGEYDDDGPQFHKRCLERLEEIYKSDANAKQLGLSFLHGCMYNVADRCGHRFTRVSA